jgi:hypothetical protein
LLPSARISRTTTSAFSSALRCCKLEAAKAILLLPVEV